MIMSAVFVCVLVATSPAFAVDLHGGRNPLVAPGLRVRAEDFSRADYVVAVDSTAKANALPMFQLPSDFLEFRSTMLGSSIVASTSVEPTGCVVAVVEVVMTVESRNNPSAARDAYGPHTSTGNYQPYASYRQGTTDKTRIAYRSTLGTSGWYDTIAREAVGFQQSVSGETSGTASFHPRTSYYGSQIVVLRPRAAGGFDVYSWSAYMLHGLVSRAEVLTSLDRGVGWAQIGSGLKIETQLPYQLGTSAFTAAASVPNQWKASVRRVATFDVVSMDEGDALLSQLNSWDAATIFVGVVDAFGDYDPYGDDDAVVAGDGPTLDGGAEGFSSWAEGLLDPFADFMPWVSYLEDL